MRVSFRRNNDFLIDENHDHREMKQSVASLNIIAAASKPPALCVLRGNCLFEDTVLSACSVRIIFICARDEPASALTLVLT
jgi:hypothetical protein